MRQHTMRFILLTLVITLISCTPRSVREAQDVVALADSLREAHLVAQDEYNDSTHLAQAYYTLEKWQWLYPDDFAHACYHYGRQLRDKDDPVSAMQVFLAATHSRTHDYHILGRVYSNMANICRLANKHDLAYRIYLQSKKTFACARDSSLYYYSQNNMAFELVEQLKIEEAISLLDSIKHACTDSAVNIMAMETHMLAKKNNEEYDSVLYYTNLLFTQKDYNKEIAYLSKAQAYFELQCYDSALYYAKTIICASNDLFNLDNALYICIHCDSLDAGSDIYSLNAERADVEKQIEIRHGKLSQAAQLLEQDLARKPDMRWLYAIIATILIIGIVNGCFVYKKRKRHQLLSQQIEDLKSQNEVQIDQMKAQLEERCAAITNSPNLKEELDWHDYDHMCAIVNLRLFGILNYLQSYSLSEKETRLCILVLLKANTSQMVDMIPYAQSGLGKFKYSTARKLGTTTANMRSFLLYLVCS